MKRSGMPQRGKRLQAVRPEGGPGLSRVPVRPCGKRYATETEAASSTRGQREGAVVERCRNAACGGFHVRNPPVPARAVPSLEPRRETGFPARVRLAVRARAGRGDPDAACCESCGKWLGRHGGQVQPRLARGTGGSRSAVVNGISNAALLCGNRYQGCHRLCEDRDPVMKDQGWWIGHGSGPDYDPRLVPVALMLATQERSLVLLAADGTYTESDGQAGAA